MGRGPLHPGAGPGGRPLADLLLLPPQQPAGGAARIPAPTTSSPTTASPSATRRWRPAASTCSRKAAASCTPSSPRTPLGTWTGWRAPIPSRRGSTGSPSASRRQTACAPSGTSLVGTSRWNKREVAPRARSWSTSCMMGGALRRRRCLPSARRASRLAWEKRFSLSGLLRFRAAFRQRCCEEGMP